MPHTAIPAHVLLVDDQPANLLALEAALDSLGVNMVRAFSGPQALQALEKQDFAAVLLDVRMPGMDGFEVARRLRADARQAGLVIVALTGWGQEEDRRRTRSGGFDRHLTKPVDVDGLLDILSRVGMS